MEGHFYMGGPLNPRRLRDLRNKEKKKVPWVPATDSGFRVYRKVIEGTLEKKMETAFMGYLVLGFGVWGLRFRVWGLGFRA